MTQPFKEFEIVRLRPEDRDQHRHGRRYWTMRDDRIVELRGFEYSSAEVSPMWHDHVGGWTIWTGLIGMSAHDEDSPHYMTECREDPLNGGSSISQTTMSKTQAEARVTHRAKLRVITEDHRRLQAHQRRGHLFELKFPYDPAMDTWMEEHTPSARLKSFGVFGQRIVIPDPDQAFAWKMRWV